MSEDWMPPCLGSNMTRLGQGSGVRAPLHSWSIMWLSITGLPCHVGKTETQ